MALVSRTTASRAYGEGMTTAAAGAPDLMTADQLAELPDDGWRHELIEGELRIMAPAGFTHGRVTFRISLLVGNHVDRGSLGVCTAAETGFVVGRDPDTVRAPDLAFTRSERVPERPSQGFSEVVPDLVVEVVSPSDRASAVTKKALFWLEAGVRLVWVIDPEARVVTVHRGGDLVTLLRGDDAILSGEDVLPGFATRLDEIFA